MDILTCSMIWMERGICAYIYKRMNINLYVFFPLCLMAHDSISQIKDFNKLITGGVLC